MRAFFFPLFLSVSWSLFGIQGQALQEAFSKPLPFPLKVLPSKQQDAPVTLCFHGEGGDSRMGVLLRKNPTIEDHVISFNFPTDPEHLIANLTPPLLILKKLVRAGTQAINLYGVRTGATAVIDLLALLQNGEPIDGVDISSEEQKLILQAVHKGYVLLDCPPPTEWLEGLGGFNLVVRCGEYEEFVSELQQANQKGKTWVIIGTDGTLWTALQEFQERNAHPNVMIGTRYNMTNCPAYQALHDHLAKEKGGDLATDGEEEVEAIATDHLDLLFIVYENTPCYRHLKINPRAIFSTKQLTIYGKAYEQLGKVGMKGWELLESEGIESACDHYRSKAAHLFKLSPVHVQFVTGDLLLVLKEQPRKPRPS